MFTTRCVDLTRCESQVVNLLRDVFTCAGNHYDSNVYATHSLRSVNLFSLAHGSIRGFRCRHRTQSFHFMSISWQAMFGLSAQIGTLDRGQHRQPMSYRHQPPFVFTETAASPFTFTFHLHLS